MIYFNSNYYFCDLKFYLIKLIQYAPSIYALLDPPCLSIYFSTEGLSTNDSCPCEVGDFNGMPTSPRSEYRKERVDILWQDIWYLWIVDKLDILNVIEFQLNVN